MEILVKNLEVMRIKVRNSLVAIPGQISGIYYTYVKRQGICFPNPIPFYIPLYFFPQKIYDKTL